MASVSQEKEDDLMVCSICLESFRKPKYLPCLHTFCEACLSRYITSALTQGPDNKQGVLCPTCRTFTTINSVETNPQKLAEDFPLNHLIVCLIDRQKAKDNDKLCDSCTRIDKSNKAEHWCNNCGEALCTQCKTFHIGNRILMNHSIVPLNELSDTLRQQSDILCSQHKDKKLEIFCYEHEVPCCVLCLAAFHRSCSKVKTIEEAGKEIRSTANLEILRTSFSNIGQKLQNEIEDRIERRKCLQNSENTMHEYVQNLRQKVISHLDKLECSLQNKITGVHKRQIDDLTEQQDILQKRKSIADNCMAILDTFQQNASDVQILLELKHLKEKENELDEFYSSEATKNKDVDVKLEISTDVSELISNVTTFGRVTEKEVTTDEPETPKFDFHSRTPEVENTLSNTRVSSAAFLPNSYILLVHYWNNKVTLIDSNGKCTSSLTLSGGPWDVTLVTPQQAVVSLPGKKQLVYINIDSSLSLSVHKTVTLNGECRGICRAGQTLLVSYRTQLIVLDLGGRIMNSIKVRGSKGLMYVTKYKDNIYLSDYNEHCVVCIDSSGTEIFRYTSDILENPWKITVDCEGNIYVAGFGSHNIHQLTGDGKLIRILPVDMKDPTCILFEENSNWFLVSSYEYETTSLYAMR